MKFKLPVFIIALAMSASVFSAPLKLTAGKYKIDPAHTRVSFTISHLVVSEVEGRFNDVEGTFYLSDKVSDGSVDVTIPVGTVDTGVAKRDEDLKSAEFFDVAKYPQMTFKSKKFTGNLQNFKVVGDLTIKDVTKEVTLSGKYTGSVKDPWGGQRAAVKATGMIRRQDFNIKYNKMIEIGAAVGDEVTINILTEGVLEK